MSATSENEIASAKPDERGMTPLHHAMRYGGLHPTRKTAEDAIADMERALALPDLDVNHQDKFGSTALHYLCQCANVDADMILRRLLLKAPNKKVDVNLLDFKGRTMLHLVVMRRSFTESQVALIQLLLKAKADVHLAIPETGNTPLHMAAGSGSCMTTLMQSLLDAGADIHSTNLMGRTPLHLTKNQPNAKFVLDLSGAEALNTTDVRGNTPLHLCLFYDHQTWPLLLDHADMAKFWIQAGSDPSKSNEKGQTAKDCIRMALDFVVDDSGLGAVTGDLGRMIEFLEVLLPVMQETFPMDDQYSSANVYGRMLWRFMQEFYEAAEDEGLFFNQIQRLLDHGATVNYVDWLHHLASPCEELQ